MTHKAKSGFLYLFLIMAIGTSILFYYYLANIDRKYSGIIEKETFFYNHVSLINNDANIGYLLLYKILETNNNAKKDSLIIQKNFLISTNDSLINEILFNLNENKDKSSLYKVIASRENYKQNIAKFEDYLEVDRKDSANDILVNKIESSFINYL